MISTEKIVEIIVKNNIIQKEKLDKLLELYRMKGGSFSKLLIDEGILPDRVLIALIGNEIGIPAINLSSFRVDPANAMLERLPVQEAQDLCAWAQAICARLGAGGGPQFARTASGKAAEAAELIVPMMARIR